MATDLDFLRDLCAAPAPTGFEAPAQEIVRRRLSAISVPEGDPLGNVWADVVPDGSPHIVVTAHNDQIGLIVTYVDELGYVSFDKIGGVDAQLLPGRNLVVHGPGGPVNGVVGRRPSHKMSKEERRCCKSIVNARESLKRKAYGSESESSDSDSSDSKSDDESGSDSENR